MKKILNDPKKASDEAIDGIVLSQPNILRRVSGRRIVVRKSAPVMGKVAPISEEEAAHTGYV